MVAGIAESVMANPCLWIGNKEDTIMITNQKQQNRLSRYRARNRRLDYYPAQDVAAIIQAHHLKGAEKVIAGVLDELIRAGNKAISGNLK